MNTLFELAYELAQWPEWIGWTLIGGACCTLSFLAGARWYA